MSEQLRDLDEIRSLDATLAAGLGEIVAQLKRIAETLERQEKPHAVHLHA